MMSQLAGPREVEQVEQLHLEESVEEGTSERKSSVGHCQGCGSFIRFVSFALTKFSKLLAKLGYLMLRVRVSGPNGEPSLQLAFVGQ